MTNILLLNGPNLNLLGAREPSLYGSQTLQGITENLTLSAKEQGFTLLNFQSNAEHLLIERIHKAEIEKVKFIVFNPAAFTHTSIALRDALLGVNIPFIEVHLSNIYQREEYRQHSYFSDIAKGAIIGLGPKGYELALTAAINAIK